MVRRSDILDSKRVLRAVVVKRSERVRVRKAITVRRRDTLGLQRVLRAIVVKRARVRRVVFLGLWVGLRVGGGCCLEAPRGDSS